MLEEPGIARLLNSLVKEKYNLDKGIVEKVIANSGLELQFDLKVTPEAEVEIIIDRSTGHALKGRGNGNIRLEISTLGKFNMLGDYQVTEGEYLFRYGGIIDKKFQVKKEVQFLGMEILCEQGLILMQFIKLRQILQFCKIIHRLTEKFPWKLLLD